MSSPHPRLFTFLNGCILFLLLAISAASAGRKQSGDVSVGGTSVSIGGRTVACQVVTLNLASGHLEPHLVTALEGIGKTESFASMIRSSRAVVAINGSFFEAYTSGDNKDPDMALIQNGQVVHKGNIGTVIGFGPRIVMDHLEMTIRGTVEGPNGRVLGWYAYWLNRAPTTPDNITLFTTARGQRCRVSGGASVIVADGRVVDVVRGDTAIPRNGYVINFRGREEGEYRKFAIGARVGYRVEIQAGQDTDFWQDVREGVGAGPRLLTNGQVTVDPVREEFNDPKILSSRGRRSAIGVLPDGRVRLVVTGGVTVGELARVMQKLGCVNAMNLDGGASSGLYANGRMLTAPGRLLSNALVFVRR